MKLIEKLCKKTDNDMYFNELYSKLEFKYFNKTMLSMEECQITEKEFYDLLRYADIMCRSNDSLYRQKSYRIISLLNEFYNENVDFRIYAEAILIKLGNFPAKKLVNSEETDIHVNSEIELEKTLKEVYQATPDNKNTFTDKQYELFEKLKNSNHFSFSGPTSFGKSFIIEEFIKYIIKERKGIDNIAILVPTRALIAQTREQLKKNIENPEYKIIEYPEIPNMYNKNKFIFIFTPERLISYLGNPDNPNVDYMFIDEAQKIISNKDTRAPLYYHAILLAQRKSIKLFFASPNIPNSDIFLKLFEKSQTENMTIKESPVNQNKFYIDLFENKFYAVSHENELIEIKSNIRDIIFNNSKEKLNYIIKEIGKVDKNIIYCNSTTDTVKLATQFSEQLEIKKNKEVEKLIEIIKENIYDDYYLIDCLKKGVAFHFGKLPQRIREKVEELFKNGDIDYVFCTSTLLEGVNLPAKNIFILSNSISRSKFSDVDFWNLAGRAGRLKNELLGNVICVRYNKKANSWQGIQKDKEIIQNNKIENITFNLLDGKNNFYNNLGRAIQNKEFTNKNASESQRKIWKNYSNLIVMHASENNSSMLIKEFLQKNKEARKIINDAQKENKIPNYILEQSPEINPRYQNEILNKKENYRFPSKITKTTCKEVLECLYDNYNWAEEESKGEKPLVKDKRRLNYLKHLMYYWITSKPLKVIITLSIRFYSRRKTIYNNGRYEYFSKDNKEQVNQVINNIMGGIDTDLRFKIKNYMVNYYLLMCEKYGKEDAGEDWTIFIEYGTTNRKNIELQKLGLPMHLAKFLLENVKEGFKFHNDNLVMIDKEKILGEIDRDKNLDEYNQILKML